MRFPNDKAFHLRMAALLIASLFLEQLAAAHLPNWSSPHIGVVTFVLGLLWVALAAFHHSNTMQNRIRVLEDKLERLSAQAGALEDERRARRALPPM